jgi:hypothetical protein
MTTVDAMKQASSVRPGGAEAIADMAGPVTRRNMPSCAERAQPPDHGILREHIFQQFSVDGKIGGYLDYLWEKRPAIASENVYRVSRCLTPCQPVSPVRSSARRTGFRLVTYLVTCPVMPKALSRQERALSCGN